MSFHFVYGFPAVKKLVTLIKSHLFIFIALGTDLKKKKKNTHTLVRFTSDNVLPMFSF